MREARSDRAAAAARLEAAGRARGCTLFQLVLGVWSLVLCRHAGQEEVVVGSRRGKRRKAAAAKLLSLAEIPRKTLKHSVGWRRRRAPGTSTGPWA